MDDKPKGFAQSVDDEDLNTTAPNPPNEWKMPEPVFRKTSGRLPQGYEKELENARAEHAAAAQDDSVPPAPATSNVPHTVPKAESGTLKLIFVLLGLSAMIAFIAVFLSVIYFFFWRS